MYVLKLGWEEEHKWCISQAVASLLSVVRQVGLGLRLSPWYPTAPSRGHQLLEARATGGKLTLGVITVCSTTGGDQHPP